MSDEVAGEPIGIICFMIDDRPVVFVRDVRANASFLESIDPLFWVYQAETHAAQLDVENQEHRQRAAAALRLVYGQGVEAMFSLLAAFVQVPTFPLGWLTKYKNVELRSVVKKIHTGAHLLSPMKGGPTWRTVSEAVHQFLPEPTRTELIDRFARFWTRLAEDFLEESFGCRGCRGGLRGRSR